MHGINSARGHLDEGHGLLKAGLYSAAEKTFRRCPPGLERELGLAEALYGNGADENRSRRALKILVREFVSGRAAALPELRRRLLELLCRVAESIDPELAECIKDNQRRSGDEGTERTSLLKAFYFAGALHSRTLGERVLESQTRLGDGMRRNRTISNDSYTIEFAKVYSSVTPLLDLSPDDAVGGGYFLNLGGFGCVVDPGHDFLANFYGLRRTIYDIDCIIVTHFHDDHYADLPLLLSLLHKRWIKDKSRSISILLDAMTLRMFQTILDADAYIREIVMLSPRNRKPIELASGITLRTLPTKHPVLGEWDTGVGLYFDIKSCGTHLVITGDTAWTPALANVYRKLLNLGVVLVAHVSSARPMDEVVGAIGQGREKFYAKHLCIHGLCKLIETVRPSKIVLSEIGEELQPVIEDLRVLIERTYGISTSIGNLAAGTFYL